MRFILSTLLAVAVSALQLAAVAADPEKNEFDNVTHFQARYAVELKGIDKKGIVVFVKEMKTLPRFRDIEAKGLAEAKFPFTPSAGEIFTFKLKSGKSLTGKIKSTGWRQGQQYKFNVVDVWEMNADGLWINREGKAADEGFFENELTGKEVVYSEKFQAERRLDFMRRLYSDYAKRLEPRVEKAMEKIRKDFPALGEEETLLYVDIADKQARDKYVGLIRKRYENFAKPLVVPMRDAILLTLDAIAKNDSEVCVKEGKLYLESELKAKAEAEAKAKAEAEAKAKAEAEEKAKAEAEAKAKAEAEAKAKEEAEAAEGTDADTARVDAKSGVDTGPAQAEPSKAATVDTSFSSAPTSKTIKPSTKQQPQPSAFPVKPKSTRPTGKAVVPPGFPPGMPMPPEPLAPPKR